MKYLKSARIKGKDFSFPIYLPDATRGVAKSLDTQDLESSKIEGMVVNTYHLISNPGIKILEKLGGVHKMMDWQGLVTSDSGGFQVLSLIYQDKKYGRVTDDGAIFNYNSTGQKERNLFTPELSIQTQFAIGSDIIVCLDDVSALNATEVEVEKNVERTIKWARRCRVEYDKQITTRRLDDKNRPWLMAVIQGGDFPELRKKCAEELLEIGFDLYGYGGFPIDDQGNFRTESLKLTAELIPDDKIKFALGVGKPQNIIECYKFGYQIFDCVLPTRDARHGRLYTFEKDPTKIDVLNDSEIFGNIDIKSGKYSADLAPISKYCDCLTCTKYTRAYLNHLFKIGDFTAGRLASIHNLKTYTRLIELLRETMS